MKVDPICTTAIFCPPSLNHPDLEFTRHGVQLAGSAAALTVNLMLIIGALNRVSAPLIVWLLSYAIAICGCIIFIGYLINQYILSRGAPFFFGSNDTNNLVYLVILVALIAVLYLVCWMFVLKFWQLMKRRGNRVFSCTI